MPNYGESFLSKVIDEGTVLPIREYEIREDDFATEVEAEVFRFITQYAEENRGRTPDYRTVVEEFPDFYYREDTADSYRYLVREIKSFSAKKKIAELITGSSGRKSLQERIQTGDGNALLEELADEMRNIYMTTAVRDKVGTDVKRDFMAFREEYDARKGGESAKIWRSHFPTINREIGGYYSGNMYTWFGRSGRGKSVIVGEEGVEAAFQGATVLIWTMEMAKYEVMARLYTSISARLGIFRTELQGIEQDAGFDNQALRNGQLTREQELALDAFFADLEDRMPGTIILRAVDDEDFQQRRVRDLESDIIRSNADVVIVDPFYYLDYEANTSRTKGGDAAETSKKIRALCGRTKAVIHVLTQADEDGQNSDEDRELNPPPRSAVKKTKQVLEDATNLFAIDTLDGIGVIQVGKGRNGGEGTSVELVYKPQYGIVKEMVEELALLSAALGF